MHLPSLFLAPNDKVSLKNDKIYGRKLHKLIPNIPKTSIFDNISHDHNKVIYNFPDYHLTDYDKLSLIRGLNCATVPNKVEYS